MLVTLLIDCLQIVFSGFARFCIWLVKWLGHQCKVCQILCMIPKFNNTGFLVSKMAWSQMQLNCPLTISICSTMSYGFKFLLHIFITPKSQLYYKNYVLLDLKLAWIVHQRNWIPMCSTLLNWGNFVMFISIASIMGIIAPMPPPTACPHPSPPPLSSMLLGVYQRWV